MAGLCEGGNEPPGSLKDKDRQATCEELSKAMGIQPTSAFSILANDLKKRNFCAVGTIGMELEDEEVDVKWEKPRKKPNQVDAQRGNEPTPERKSGSAGKRLSRPSLPMAAEDF
ncbi:hypothetical protein ANN_24343 [Periplaneta americana]|uniref:Uncharacterized protein n=1 Tax=Periplaneta americana TaxID=6978 RepID=A0ABQ8S2T4_PERAM|nr:hypothetical protein ANN_24343 [Periplaneta americana]